MATMLLLLAALGQSGCAVAGFSIGPPVQPSEPDRAGDGDREIEPVEGTQRPKNEKPRWGRIALGAGLTVGGMALWMAVLSSLEFGGGGWGGDSWQGPLL